ncbi:hypothetical protein C4D60_Mb03t14820 [Musa balbisiana]|uniref:Uncharacterized protein n=1 Tax=Musa balbisiana TaxID=52838 RepID=A0A4S8JB34_MUSBA|nr:hypothetical protein C4D60_Mb03t14820 [Musa balbisiana]
MVEEGGRQDKGARRIPSETEAGRHSTERERERGVGGGGGVGTEGIRPAHPLPNHILGLGHPLDDDDGGDCSY